MHLSIFFIYFLILWNAYSSLLPIFSIGLFVFFLLTDWSMYILDIRALLAENIFSHLTTRCLHFLGGREQRHKHLLPLNSSAYCLGTLGSLLSLHGQWLPFLMQLKSFCSHKQWPCCSLQRQAAQEAREPLWEKQCEPSLVFSFLLLPLQKQRKWNFGTVSTA